MCDTNKLKRERQRSSDLHSLSRQNFMQLLFFTRMRQEDGDFYLIFFYSRQDNDDFYSNSKLKITFFTL